MRTVRGEYKVSGGKLVAVNVEVDGSGRPVTCRIDGDFFVEADSDADSDALVADIGARLVAGESVDRAIAAHPGTRLVGCDAAAIETAFARAMGETSPDPRHGVDSVRREDSDAVAAAEAVDFEARWARLLSELTIVHDVPRSPREQMAIDERWAREVAAGARRPTVRIWEWSGSCVVVGRFQSIPDEVHESVARAEGIEVVRRCTGGGAMFIEPGDTITYSLYAPLWFVEGVDVADSYRLCDRWLVGALRKLGLDVRFSGLNDIASSHGKIGGAAQRRFPAPRASAGSAGTGVASGPTTPAGPGAVLHHVTMAYDIDAARMGRVLNTSREKMSDKAVRSAVKRVDPLKSQTGLTRDAIVARLLAYLGSRVSGSAASR